jgi:anti-anti-sigma factor
MELLGLEKAELSPGIWSLALRGSLDASNVATLEAAASEILAGGARNLLIILRKAEFVSSTGFSSLVKITDLAAANGGKVVFVASPSRIQAIFKVLGLERVLSFAPDENAALEFLSSRPSATP